MKWTGLVVIVSFLTVGCGSEGSGLSVSAKIGTSSAALSSSSALTLGGGVVVDHVRIALRSIKLETEVTSGGSSSSGHQEFALSPRVLHFDLQGVETPRLQQAFTADVPARTYRQIKFRVHHVEQSDIDAVSDPSVKSALQEVKDYSIVIAGTYNGVPFTFRSSLDEEQEREGSFEVGAGSNITLSIDPTGWFDDGAGGVLDPGQSSSKSQIESNIKNAIGAYDDDDRDGRPDPS